MKLGTKLLVTFLAIGVIPFASIGIYSLLSSSRALSDQAYRQLESVREIKKEQIEKFFSERRGDMGVLVDTVSAMTWEAFQKLSVVQQLKKAELEKLFARIQDDISTLASSEELRLLYRALNMYADEKGIRPDDPFDVKSERYQAIYKRHFPFFHEFIKTHGYYDVFLISAEGGQVMFTDARESDLGANLKTGALKDQGLGHLWRRVVKSKGLVIEDFSAYSPSNNQQAAFIGAPLLDQAGTLIAVVALQLATEPISEIVDRRQGLGKTGESYLMAKVDGRYLFRSNMKTMGGGKFVIGYDVTDIAPAYVKAALEGKAGEGIFLDSAQRPNFVAYAPLKLPGLNWALVSKVTMEEILATRLPGEKKDFYAKYIEKYGYYDLFLVAPNGYCFYTVAHEPDYRTNLVSGKYASSNLGALVRRVLESRRFGLADFAPYAPSKGEPAAFIAQPVIQKGKVALVVALQLSLDAINAIMKQRAGLGKTGETYLVGPDKLMRSDSYLDPKYHSVKASFADPERGKVDTEAVRLALAGKTGNKVIIDYNGNPVLSAFSPVKLFGVRWALLAEIDEAEAFAAVYRLEWVMMVMALVGIALIVVVALLIGRSISRPITRVVEGLTAGSDQVAAAAGQVSSASQSLAQGASQQAASLEETSASMEEMASMTKANADNSAQADEVMRQAKDVVEEAGQSMEETAEAMTQIAQAGEEISKIVKSIDEIAFQTNLLALNAAVEAARAGEAGAGFAVVADEVRSLAMRAAEAAKNTQDLVEDTVRRINQGSDLVDKTMDAFKRQSEMAAQVASLISEISAASNEQAQGIEQINRAIGEMDRVTQQVAANAEESAAASEELSAQAETMQGMVAELVSLVEGAGKKVSPETKDARRVLLPGPEPEEESGA